MLVKNYKPKFKIVEINNVAALRTGHMIDQIPAYVDGEGAKVTATVFGDYKFVENGLIVGLDETNVLANYNAEKHSRPCLIYTEELTCSNNLELDQFAHRVSGAGKPVYVRALPLSLGDTFTTNNVSEMVDGAAFAKVNADGRLELEKERSADTMFIAKNTDLPAGQKAVEFTYVGLALKSATKLITFTVTEDTYNVTTEYKAEEGMTWKDWVDSKYNTSGTIVVSYNGIVLGGNMSYNNISGGLPNEESKTQRGEMVILNGAVYSYNKELPDDWV